MLEKFPFVSKKKQFAFNFERDAILHWFFAQNALTIVPSMYSSTTTLEECNSKKESREIDFGGEKHTTVSLWVIIDL
jgi:hypothetical protein